jgi:Flp pilus assembly protein TadG
MLSSRRWGRSRKRTGAHLVEFALVAPIFITFVLGMLEIGRGMMVITMMTNAARQGARVGIIEGKATSDITAVVTAALGRRGGFAGYTTTVKVNGQVADASTANANDIVSVVISVPAAQVTWLPAPFFLRGTLQSQFSLPRE